MPPTLLPTPSHFPQSLNPMLHPSPSSTSTAKITNTILFLPGLGDTSPNFSPFPTALNLPETLTITLQPPFPLPFGLTPTPSYHWSDDLSISNTGDLDATDSGFVTASKLIAEDVIRDLLMRDCGFRGEEIQIFGFGQGGSLALSIPLHQALEGMALGGVVSVGGPLPLTVPEGKGKNGTPVLVLGGTRGAVFGGDTAGSRVKRIEGRYERVEEGRWRKGDDGMPKNREEVLPLMRFWGRTLRSWRGVPEGAVEVG